MNRAVGAGLLVLSLVSCGPGRNLTGPCQDCTAGTGGLAISLALTSADVVRVTATVTGTGITTPMTTDLTIGGSPLTASGSITSIPVGPQQTVTLSAYPAAVNGAEGAVVIFQGQGQVAITAGQITTASIELFPIMGDVAVTANFPANDVDVAKIDHTTVVVSGARIQTPATFYLLLSTSANDATGTAQKIPVGLTRTVTVTSFSANGTQLHQGTATTAVATSGTSVTVSMANTTGLGVVSLDGGLCIPACGNAVCGDDGCGGSCGGCQPNAQCTSGACSVGPAACSWTQTESYPLTSSPANSVVRNGGAGGQGIATVSGRTAWSQTSDWNVLLLPTGLASGDDAFSVSSQIYIPNISSGSEAANMVLFTTTSTANGPQGTCQWVGGVWGGVYAAPGSGSTVEWWDSTGCPQNLLQTAALSSPTGQWHQFVIKGLRSTCAYEALLDGVVVSNWTGTCAATGGYIGLFGTGSAGMAWSNLTVSKGTPSGCVP